MNVDLCMNHVSCTWLRDIKTYEVIVINRLSLICCNLRYILPFFCFSLLLFLGIQLGSRDPWNPGHVKEPSIQEEGRMHLTNWATPSLVISCQTGNSIWWLSSAPWITFCEIYFLFSMKAVRKVLCNHFHLFGAVQFIIEK